MCLFVEFRLHAMSPRPFSGELILCDNRGSLVSLCADWNVTQWRIVRHPNRKSSLAVLEIGTLVQLLERFSGTVSGAAADAAGTSSGIFDERWRRSHIRMQERKEMC
jgi:hypothetical protein